MCTKLFTLQLDWLHLQGDMLGPTQIVLTGPLFNLHLHFTACSEKWTMWMSKYVVNPTNT